MRKWIYLAVCLIALPLSAQVKNLAATNEGQGWIQTAHLSELDGIASFTLQCWINPTEWIAGAGILEQASSTGGWSLKLGENPGELLFSMPGGSLSGVAGISGALPVNAWTHLTLVYEGGSAIPVSAYFNNAAAGVSIRSAFPASVQPADAPLTMLSGFKGRMDECRIWSGALPQEEFSYNNTLNKFHSCYDSLLAYWKFDQSQCEHIVDYTFRYHGVQQQVSRQEVTDNAAFKYRVVTGYTSFNRFIDRPNIDRDMYLMTNDLILLSAKVMADGKIFIEFPDNQGQLTNAEHLASYNGRDGVLSFKGLGARMDVEGETFLENPVTGISSATFEGWIYIEQWQEGAALLKKYKSDGQQISVTLGNEESKSLVVNVNGYEFVSNNQLREKEWMHVAVKFVCNSARFNRKVVFQYNAGTEVYADSTPASGELDALPLFTDAPTVIGEDFNGKMDKIMIWRTNRSASSVANDANGEYKLPSGSYDDIMLCSYWKADDPDNPGKDSQSWREIVAYMRKQYEGYDGYKIRFGLINGEGDKWKTMIADTEKLNTFISEVERILPYTDGIDIDFEWAYTTAEFNNYGNMVERLRAIVPADKVFTCSLHAVSYSLAKKYIDMVDYFTFQIYGPSPYIYAYSEYVSAYNKFIAQGFPKEKILLSIGVLATNDAKAVVGYKNIIEANPDLGPDVDGVAHNGSWYVFNGVNTIRKKQQFILDNDLLGTMYFDMGNDMKVSNPKSLIRAMNGVIASNVDSVVTVVDLGNTSWRLPQQQEKKCRIYPNPAREYVTVAMKSPDEAEGAIHSMVGNLVRRFRMQEPEKQISLAGIPDGAYILSLKQNGECYQEKLLIRNF